MITSDQLTLINRRLDTDFEPYGKRVRETIQDCDCSCGCKYFAELNGKLGLDWGVCVNPDSPRVGLLTFEHQGCNHFVVAEEKTYQAYLKREANNEN